MTIATADRGYILHFAARHALSPALRAGQPALSAAREGLERCGWERFFAALDGAGGWLALDDEAPEAARAASGGEAGGMERHRHSLKEDWASARRFLAAIRARDPS